MNREKETRVVNGWVILPLTVALFAVAIALVVAFGFSVARATAPGALPNFYLLGGAVVVAGLGIFSCFGYFTLHNRTRAAC